MADSTYTRGEMDIAEQTSTFNLVMGMTKWGSLALAAFLTWAVLMFCTATGFLGAAAVAVVLLALGIFFLRDKKTAGH